MYTACACALLFYCPSNMSELFKTLQILISQLFIILFFFFLVSLLSAPKVFTVSGNCNFKQLQLFLANTLKMSYLYRVSSESGQMTRLENGAFFRELQGSLNSGNSLEIDIFREVQSYPFSCRGCWTIASIIIKVFVCFGHAHGLQKFSVQGLNLSHSSDNSGFLTAKPQGNSKSFCFSWLLQS